VLDLLQAELRAPHQHHPTVLSQRLRTSRRDSTPGSAPRKHVHVEREADLELGQLEQALHQQHWIDGAALGLEHQAHGLGRLVAHVAQQGQLLLVDQLGDALDQLRLLYLIGDFGDDDLISAAELLFVLTTSATA
jgi:hypothetical protein